MTKEQRRELYKRHLEAIKEEGYELIKTYKPNNAKRILAVNEAKEKECTK